MNEVNRGVIVLRPKKPFLDWVNFIDADGVVLTLDEVSEDCTAYLTPEIEDDDELKKFLGENYNLLFEQELAEWIWDEAQWPASRGLSTFLEWFSVEFHSVVLDVVEGGLAVVADDN